MKYVIRSALLAVLWSLIPALVLTGHVDPSIPLWFVIGVFTVLYGLLVMLTAACFPDSAFTDLVITVLDKLIESW